MAGIHVAVGGPHHDVAVVDGEDADSFTCTSPSAMMPMSPPRRVTRPSSLESLRMPNRSSVSAASARRSRRTPGVSELMPPPSKV